MHETNSKDYARRLEKNVAARTAEFREQNGACLPTKINIKPFWFKGRHHHLYIVRDITRRVKMEKKRREMECMTYIGHLTSFWLTKSETLCHR